MALVVSGQLKYKTMILVFICVYFVSQAVGELSIIDNVVTIQDLDDDNKHNKGSYQSGIQVETEQGLVRGYQDEAGIVTFFDIPYGEFSKEQPFQEPTPSKPWEAVHDKTSHSTRCPQIRSGTFEGTHECLTLTVMKPKDAAGADVLFHIHDSSFTSGSGDPLVYNPKHIVPKGVILVLPNYRLGPLGFLCLQNNTAPGNAGLKRSDAGVKLDEKQYRVVWRKFH
ncbi:unnamed protein product [Danaus chrysippus]|uniref:(African queen) hypothetical protein n=1 Tax=Danaus chrysippus TaxID=151541 RepID=A0A8J2QM52_9NEOP|nr:unnamed protein product [Danaus chrysippus]